MLSRTVTRLVLARNDLLTSFDLRAQIFRVNVEFPTFYHRQKIFLKKCPKVTFWLEKNVSKFFWNSPFRTTDYRQNIGKFFFERKGSYRSFFEKQNFDFSSQNGYQTTPFWPLMILEKNKWPLIDLKYLHLG